MTLGDDLSITPEEAVIAAVLLDARVLPQVIREVNRSDFGDDRLGVILAGMLAMSAEGEPIDVVTVSQRLARWGVRGIEDVDLHRWMGAVPTAASASAYAALVHEGGLRREIRVIAGRMVAEAASNEPGVALEHAVESLQKLRQIGTGTRLEVKPLGAVLTEADAEFEWVIEGLLERGDRLLITGSEGGGKTTLVRQLAIMSAAGIHPFTFFRMPPVRVLVIDAENSERQWRRETRELALKAKAYGQIDPARTVMLVCTPRLDLTRDHDLGLVHQAVDEYAPDVLFIGPLYKLVRGAINDDNDAAPLLAALDTLRDRGLAMVIEAHAGHATGASGERDLRPRGSSALLGWPEFGLGLRFDKGGRSSNDFELIRWRGDREQRRWPSRISRGASEWPWTPSMALR